MGTQAVIPQRKELDALTAQITQLRGKLADAEDELARLKKELTRTAEQIALEREKPEKINDISRRIEQCEARISGYRSVIDSKDAEIRVLTPQLRQIEETTMWERRRAELANLVTEGKAITETINAKLRSIIIEDLVKFDSIRDQLGASHLIPLGSANACIDLIRELVDERGQLVIDRQLTNVPWTQGQAWERRADLQLLIQNLYPPRK